MITTARRLAHRRTRSEVVTAAARINKTADEVSDVDDGSVSPDVDPLAIDPDADVLESDQMPNFGDEEAGMSLDGHSSEDEMLAQMNQPADRQTNSARLGRGEAQGIDADPEEWLTSDAWMHYTRKGCHDQRNRDFPAPSPPLWLCDFMGSREKADVLAAIIYWFGMNRKTNQPMARHRDRRGRRFIYKTQDEIANEAGISGSRRRETIGRYLKEFAELGLLEYKTNSRQTTIWLIPSGIQRAYDSVPHHQE